MSVALGDVDTTHVLDQIIKTGGAFDGWGGGNIAKVQASSVMAFIGTGP